MGCANYVIELYGVREFIADTDRNREYWRDGESIIHSILTWASEDGFHEFIAQYNLDYGSAHEFRQRHLIRGVAALLARR